jgi:hypothetical protein
MSLLSKLFGGSKQSSQSGLDPDFKNRYMQNADRANTVADGLGARQYADFTQDWQQGADQIRNTAMGGAGYGSMNSAAGALTGATQYQPQQVAGGAPVQAGSFLSGNIGAYMNPYQDQVIDRTLQASERGRQMAQVNDAARMTAAGAFGNSRRGIVESQTNEAYDRNRLDALANLSSQGFDRATALQAQDQDRTLTGDSFNSTQQQAAQLANQTAGLQNQQNITSAATNLASVGQAQQQAGYQAGEALQGVGGAYQQLDQARMDANRNLGMEQQAIRNEALGINPGGGAGMTNTSSGSSSNGAVGGIASLIAASDRRMKADIDYNDDALDKLAFLRGATYRYKGDDERTGGVMAQDLERVMPQAVGMRPDGMKDVDYTAVTGLLVDAVNELASSKKGARRA